MNGRMEKEKVLSKKANEILEDMPDYVGEWYAHMSASAKTGSTMLDYLQKVRKYINSINKNNTVVSLEDLSYKSVINYMKSIKQKENAKGEIVATSGAYQKSVWFALSSFFKYLYKRKYITENYMEDISISKKSDCVHVERNRKYLTINDFKKIVDATSEIKNPYFRTRDKAILLTFMCTGVRCRALTQINLSDINFINKTVTVIDKEDAERDCDLTETAIEAIGEWNKYRRRGLDTDALFLSSHNKRISEREIETIVKKYTKSSLGYELSPHKLRAGFCTILYNETKDIRYVQKTVGHKNVTTTERYMVVNNNGGETIGRIFDKIGA